MECTIIGAGASGILAALEIKSKNKNIDVTLIEKNKIIGKKLLATGNGRCNLGNNIINDNSYNKHFLNEEIPPYNALFWNDLLKKYGIFTRNIENLVYPYSLSAKTLVDHFSFLLRKYKINVLCEEKFLNYERKGDKYEIILSNKKIISDILVISSGAKSMKCYGSDGSIFDILNNHGYKINDLFPGLCPIKIKEKVSEIENERVKCKVTLLDDSKAIYEETGEVIFKKDALSGIAIFNCSSIIKRKRILKPIIKLDLFPEYELDKIIEQLNNDYKEYGNAFLEHIFTKRMSNFILKKTKNSSLEEFVKISKNLNFEYNENYGFDYSQVTIGGVDLSNLDINLMSKHEKNLFIIGEALDVDGLCGGYNLMHAFYSAAKVAKFISQIQ